jgi:hypothetical protein
MLILGGVLFIVGLAMWGQTDVTCDGNVMSAGDTCTHVSKRGTTTVNSFEEEKSSQVLFSKIGVFGGGALTIGGITWIVLSKRRKPEQAAPAAA